MLKNLFKRFSNVCETNEGHSDSELKSHYYRANKDTIFRSLEEILKNRPGYAVVDSSKERGEIACDLKKPVPSFLIATIVTVRPFETAVDFHLSTERPAIMGNYASLKREIISLYRELDKLNTFIGSGRNSE